MIKSTNKPLASIDLKGARSQSLLDSFLESRSERTQKAYRQDLTHLATFLDLPSAEGATMVLIANGKAKTTNVINKYRDFLDQKGLCASTINRKLCAIRVFLQYAKDQGEISWTIKVDAISKMAEDNAPQKIPALKRLIASLDRTTAKGYRDFAILRLIFDLALRRSELVALNYPESVDLENRVLILNQHKKRIQMPLPEETWEALQEWIAMRGSKSGPLFINYDPARKGDRLTGRSIDRNVVKPLAVMIGLHISPHRLRHIAIEEALSLARKEKLGLDDVITVAKNLSRSTASSAPPPAMSKKLTNRQLSASME